MSDDHPGVQVAERDHHRFGRSGEDGQRTSTREGLDVARRESAHVHGMVGLLGYRLGELGGVAHDEHVASIRGLQLGDWGRSSGLWRHSLEHSAADHQLGDTLELSDQQEAIHLNQNDGAVRRTEEVAQGVML